MVAQSSLLSPELKNYPWAAEKILNPRHCRTKMAFCLLFPGRSNANEGAAEKKEQLYVSPLCFLVE